MEDVEEPIERTESTAPIKTSQELIRPEHGTQKKLYVG